jgi:hypothetical protein
VRVDIRGSGDSDGVLTDEYLQLEQDDALEVIAWIARQPWCTGRVGGIGQSYYAMAQWLMATFNPPALACIGDTGAAVIDLDGSLSRPALEATFPAGGGGFVGGPRGRLAFDGRCGPEPPSSTDLGPGAARPIDLNEEPAAAPAPPEPAGPPELPPDDQPLLFDFHLFDLLAALKDVLNRVPDAGIEITAEAVSITDKIATILARLESVDSLLFADLFDGSTTKAHIIATFMALLELMKNRIVKAVQIEQFGAIRLMKSVTDEATPTSGDLFA